MSRKSVTITGADQLSRDLGELAGALEDLSAPLVQAAEQVARDVRRGAPVSTGALRRSIRVQDAGRGAVTVAVTARYARPVLARRNFIAGPQRSAESTAAGTLDRHVAQAARQAGLTP